MAADAAMTDDLAGRLVTSRYQSWKPEDGVPVSITIGLPKFWRGPPLVDARLLAPWGLMDPAMPTDECRQRYEQRLDDQADRVVALLARIAAEHPDQRLVLCCYEDVETGEPCHRRWLASWLEDRYDLDVPEMLVADDDEPAVVEQQQLPFS
jgi:hypothetical protein